MLSKEWDNRFACGPAYIIGDGDPNSAFAVAMYFRKPVIGISKGDFFWAPWMNKSKLFREGAILIGTSAFDPAKYVPERFSKGEAPHEIAAPYRHSFSRKRHRYKYYFVPPEGCG